MLSQPSIVQKISRYVSSYANSTLKPLSHHTYRFQSSQSSPPHILSFQTSMIPASTPTIGTSASEALNTDTFVYAATNELTSDAISSTNRLALPLHEHFGLISEFLSHVSDGDSTRLDKRALCIGKVRILHPGMTRLLLRPFLLLKELRN